MALFNVTADSATYVGADTKVDLIDVEDNAINIELNIVDLHALGSKLENITLTDDESVQDTQAQKTAYQNTLIKILRKNYTVIS